MSDSQISFADPHGMSLSYICWAERFIVFHDGAARNVHVCFNFAELSVHRVWDYFDAFGWNAEKVLITLYQVQNIAIDIL